MSRSYTAIADPRPTLSLRNWLHGILVGGATGLVVLGVGGRLAMRAIALQERPAAAFTVGGTITVMLLGAASGIAGGLLHVLLFRFLPHFHWLRRTLFAALLILITLRGLSGTASALSVTLFLPLVVVYGIIVAGLLERRARSEWETPDPLAGSAYRG
jgi:hypothetical protein